jgi:hypothetical protein
MSAPWRLCDHGRTDLFGPPGPCPESAVVLVHRAHVTCFRAYCAEHAPAHALPIETPFRQCTATVPPDLPGPAVPELFGEDRQGQ